jgi:broad specificity phosphatase PhoE
MNAPTPPTPGTTAPSANERFEPPLYLARFRDSEGARRNAAAVEAEREHPEADGTPIYLRRFRSRSEQPPHDVPLWQRGSHATQQALTEDNRNKEISAPPSAQRSVLNDVYLIRHGETQGYSTDSGLTPQGSWQAHTYGHTLAKRMKSGETIVFRHADTNRARETAEQIHRGLLDGIKQYEKELVILEPEPMDEFRNFQFVAPDGLKDVTAAFRQFQTLYENFERRASAGTASASEVAHLYSDRPLWLVEMDRFWRVQEGGGDPIQHWLTMPMTHFEPPALAVRRFWRGITKLSDAHPGARLAVATHSGCIRAFAVAALGYDPGEPYNTEHVRVKLYGSADSPRAGMTATIGYRNRVQEWKVPDPSGLPLWGDEDNWSPRSQSTSETDHA